MYKKLTDLLLGGALISALSMAAVSCKDYGGDIDDLDARMEKVESALKDLKSQIAAGAVVTNVETLSNGVKVTLSDGKTFTLTNGKDGVAGKDGTAGKDGAAGNDGADGKDGRNGSVVTVGDNGNWFIDGVDTGKPSKGADGKDGKNGIDGKDGTDGKDAVQVYYVPNMQTGMWDKVTVESGKSPVVEPTSDSWKASGVVAVWDKVAGTLTFTGVDGADAPVVISLNGVLKTLAFVPETMSQGLGVIDFHALYKGTSFVTSSRPEVMYRLNPENADVENVKWSVIDRKVTTKVEGDNSSLVKIESFSKTGDGGMRFVLKATGDGIPDDASMPGEQTLVALKAERDGDTVVSDYAFVEKGKVTRYAMIHASRYASGRSVMAFPERKPAISDPDDIELVYDESVNVMDSLSVFAPEISRTLEDINVELSYKVSVCAGKYLGSDGVTDQQKFITLKDGVLSVNEEWLANGGRAAIGRTPLLEVAAVVKDGKGKEVKLAEAYVKVMIVDRKSSPSGALGDMDPVIVTGKFGYDDLPAAADPAKPSMALSWERVNAEVLDVLGLSYGQFTARYNVDSPEVTMFGADGKKVNSIAGVSCDAAGLRTPTGTNYVTVDIVNLADENTHGALNVTIPAVDNRLDKNVIVRFEFSVEHKPHFPQLNPDYLVAENTVQVKGRMDGGRWVMKSGIREHFLDYLSGYSDPANHGALKFALRPLVKSSGKPLEMGKTMDPAKLKMQDGAEISGSGYMDQEIVLTAPLAGKSAEYEVTMYNELANGHFCQKNYAVRFISPFSVEASALELKTLAAAPDFRDLSELVTVKDLDGKVILDKNGVSVYGQNTYNFSASDFVPTFSLVFQDGSHASLDTEESFGGRLELSGSVVTWNNMGGTLVNDKNAAYRVEMNVGDICVSVQEGLVKVLSVEHSR